MSYTPPENSTVLTEIVEEKCRLISEIPGLEVDFTPEEADLAGAFREDALDETEAKEASSDEFPYGENI